MERISTNPRNPFFSSSMKCFSCMVSHLVYSMLKVSLLYAHDESPEVAFQRVSVHLRKVDEFHSHWGIKINLAKRCAICLLWEFQDLKLILNASKIRFNDNFKYFGVYFSKLLKFINHAYYCLEKANRLKGAFAKLLGSKCFPVGAKLLLYKVIIRTILLYPFPIWTTILKTVMRRMEMFEQNIIRKCIGKIYKSE